MNRDLPAMLEDVLSRGLKAMVLTNAMKPMHKMKPALLGLLARHGRNLTIRVSLDHYERTLHEKERGARSWKPTIDGLVWLAQSGFDVHVAGRRFSEETEAEVRAGYARLFAGLGITIDAASPVSLVLFPEMDSRVDVPEITTACWGILKKSPDSVMCASARMVVKRKGAAAPGRRRLHPAALRPAVRARQHAGRKRRRRAPQPSALRQVLRAGRRGLQPVTTDIDVVIPTLNAARSLAPTLDSLGGDHGLRLAVTVCDGGSRDDTTTIARQAGANVLVSRTRSRPATWRRRHGGQRAVAAVPARRHDAVDRLGRRRAPIHGDARAKGRLLPAALRVGRSARPTPGAPRRLALPHLRPALRRPGTPDRARLLSPARAAFAPCL